ncbi:hypothetical protein Tco_0389433 [Tanacetum coccineum]
MESSKSSQPNHPYSPINRINLDMDFKHNIFSQDYNYSQDYSMGYGSGHGSAHGSAPVNDEEEDDSPVEEVSPVKPNKPSRRASKAKKDDPNEPPIDWTVAEKIALYQAWCDVSENNIAGNNMKTRGFWDAVITYFEKETGSTSGQKKSKTSETTSGSASGGINLNVEADEDVEETQEVRPMGRDQLKAEKKSAVPLVEDLLHLLIW